MRILELGPQALHDYEQISIAYEVRSRVLLEPLLSTGKIVEQPVEPWVKDYDAGEKPSSLADLVDVSHWVVLHAEEEGRTVGSAIVAWNSEQFDMLEGRLDLAILVDLRVDPSFRGRGIGRALFESAADWARRKGCTELRVETQDVNVPACRFYQAMGCVLCRAQERAYAPANEETMLLWSLRL